MKRAVWNDDFKFSESQEIVHRNILSQEFPKIQFMTASGQMQRYGRVDYFAVPYIYPTIEFKSRRAGCSKFWAKDNGKLQPEVSLEIMSYNAGNMYDTKPGWAYLPTLSTAFIFTFDPIDCPFYFVFDAEELLLWIDRNDYLLESPHRHLQQTGNRIFEHVFVSVKHLFNEIKNRSYGRLPNQQNSRAGVR